MVGGGRGSEGRAVWLEILEGSTSGRGFRVGVKRRATTEGWMMSYASGRDRDPTPIGARRVVFDWRNYAVSPTQCTYAVSSITD